MELLNLCFKGSCKKPVVYLSTCLCGVCARGLSVSRWVHTPKCAHALVLRGLSIFWFRDGWPASSWDPSVSCPFPQCCGYRYLEPCIILCSYCGFKLWSSHAYSKYSYILSNLASLHAFIFKWLRLMIIQKQLLKNIFSYFVNNFKIKLVWFLVCFYQSEVRTCLYLKGSL